MGKQVFQEIIPSEKTGTFFFYIGYRVREKDEA